MGESNAAATYPMQCSALRKGGFVVMKGHPCKVVNMSTSKTGKHGHAKVNLTGIDIFTEKKYEDIVPSTHNVEVPNVSRNEYTLVNIDDGFMSLMTETGDMKEDLRVPDTDVGKQIQSAFDDGKEIIVVVQSAMGIEQAMTLKDVAK